MFPEEFGKDSFTAVERSIRRFNNIGASGIYWLGLHRRRTFEKTNHCFPGIHTCHVTVVAELACQGPFYCCDSELFYYRKHSGSGTRRIKEKHNFLVRRWPDECELLDWIDRLPLSGSDRRIVRRQTEVKIRERLSV